MGGMATYTVKAGEQQFSELPAGEALAKVRELAASGADPYLYDHRGDPMGLCQLEEALTRGKA